MKIINPKFVVMLYEPYIIANNGMRKPKLIISLLVL